MQAVLFWFTIQALQAQGTHGHGRTGKEYNAPVSTGIPMRLELKAQKRFCRIVATVLHDSFNA